MWEEFFNLKDFVDGDRQAPASQTPDLASDLPDAQSNTLLDAQLNGRLDWQPTTAQLDQFEKLYHLVLEGNKTQNLTRITTPADFGEKHLWDSLRGILPMWLRQDLKSDLKAIDIGTGAGFPGLVIAIAQPTWQLSLIDGTHKKIAFIDSVIQALALTNAIAIAARAEELSRDHQHRRQYDLVTVRALGSVEQCAKYAMPFLKANGMAVLYRGQLAPEERDRLKAICPQIHAQIQQIDRFATPITNSVRHCIYLECILKNQPQIKRDQNR